MTDQILTPQQWKKFSTVLCNANRLFRDAEVVTDVSPPDFHCWIADELDCYTDLISQCKTIFLRRKTDATRYPNLRLLRMKRSSKRLELVVQQPIYRRMGAGNFPRSIALGGNSIT